LFPKRSGFFGPHVFDVLDSFFSERLIRVWLEGYIHGNPIIRALPLCCLPTCIVTSRLHKTAGNEYYYQKETVKESSRKSCLIFHKNHFIGERD
jgi:hypothetical protein